MAQDYCSLQSYAKQLFIISSSNSFYFNIYDFTAIFIPIVEIQLIIYFVEIKHPVKHPSDCVSLVFKGCMMLSQRTFPRLKL